MGHFDDETGLLKISWSKIRTAEECRQKAFLVSEGKSNPVTDVRVFLQGNIVDQAMRRWLSMPDPQRGWMAAHVGEIMDELERKVLEDGDGAVRWRGSRQKDREEVRAFCTECAVRLEVILFQLAIPYEYQPAIRFKTRLTIPGLDGTPTPVLLNGEMDLLVRQQPALRVWDLKVTKDPQYWRKTVAQLVFYDLACWCMTGQLTEESGLIQPMVEGTPFFSFRPSDEDRTQMLTRIERVAHAIWHGDHAPKSDSTGCSWCEVRHACSKYAPEPGTNRIALF